MKKNYQLYMASLIILLTFHLSAQNKAIVVTQKNAIKANSITTIDALQTYERVVEKGYKSVDMFKKLGNTCFFKNELDQAAKWYKELFNMTTNLEPEYYYRYGHSLKAIGENQKANEILEKYSQFTENKN